MKGIKGFRHQWPCISFHSAYFWGPVSLSCLSLPAGAKLIVREKQGLMQDGGRGKPRPYLSDCPLGTMSSFVHGSLKPGGKREVLSFSFLKPVSRPELGILSNQPPGTFSQLFSVLSSTWLFLLCRQSKFICTYKKKKKDLILPVFKQMFFPGFFFLSFFVIHFLTFEVLCSLGPNQRYLYC